MERCCPRAALGVLSRNRRLLRATVTGRMACGKQPEEHSADDEQAVIEQAERILSEQADITLGEASKRMTRYARFNDLPLIDVSRGIVSDTVRLLTIRENDNLANRPGGGPDPRPP
jgi:hypothetical protein